MKYIKTTKQNLMNHDQGKMRSIVGVEIFE